MTLAALAAAFGAPAEVADEPFAVAARRGKSLPSLYPKRSDSESAARMTAAEEKRKRKAEKRRTVA